MKATEKSTEPKRASDRPRLPFEAEYVLAENRKFEETIVFVHHFGGSKRTVTRHARLANRLGFDVVRFDLLQTQVSTRYPLPISGQLRIGLRHIWSDQIESILNAIPGRKVLYTFSMPSASAIAAISRRRARDIAGMICDGGPFFQLWRCSWNLYEHEYKVKSHILRAAFTAASQLVWGLDFEEQTKKLVAKIPAGFPILSIRGWKDQLVSPQAIDEVFADAKQIDLETLPLPEGGHLDGLKKYPERYIERVSGFLDRIATPLPDPAGSTGPASTVRNKDIRID